jgi:hypothetical protein
MGRENPGDHVCEMEKHVRSDFVLIVKDDAENVAHQRASV